MFSAQVFPTQCSLRNSFLRGSVSRNVLSKWFWCPAGELDHRWLGCPRCVPRGCSVQYGPSVRCAIVSHGSLSLSLSLSLNRCFSASDTMFFAMFSAQVLCNVLCKCFPRGYPTGVPHAMFFAQVVSTAVSHGSASRNVLCASVSHALFSAGVSHGGISRECLMQCSLRKCF